MTLFLNTIANDVAGTVCFSLPVISEDGNSSGSYVEIEAFLCEDPQISMKNNWESVIPDVTQLNDFTNLVGLGNASWISTSKASWKGTEPISITLNFYLITFRNNQINGSSSTKPCDMPVSVQASYFAQLLAVSPQAGSGGSVSDWGVGIHGGYKPNYFADNSTFAGNGQTTETQNQASQDASNQLKNIALSVGDNDGTIQIIINGGGRNTAVFTKMLLADATFTPSTVRTGYWTTRKDGSMEFVTSKEPLYIKVTATFRLMHAATIADANRMFTGKGTL